MYSCSRDTSSLLLREQSWPLNVKNDSQTADNFSWPMLNSLSPATYMAHADYEVKFSFIKSVLLHVERVQLIVPLSVFAVWTTKLQLHSASHTHICNMLLSVHHNSTIQFHLFSITKINGISWSCSQAVSKPVCHTPLLCVQWKTPDDGQRNCPKHVQFYSKNKFEKLVHLVGFIIRIYHDAWSPERQINTGITMTVVLYLYDLTRMSFLTYLFLGGTGGGDTDGS